VNEGLVTTLAWQGQQVEAIRDSWLVRMPTPANPLSLTFAGYRARAPQVPAGWSIDTLHCADRVIMPTAAYDDSTRGSGSLQQGSAAMRVRQVGRRTELMAHLPLP
jgi:hypothetical protein